MAGAGFKTFNTGDVLTASDVNTYLMQQTVMVFASAAARTTALGANVAEGMISYLKDTNAVEVYDGSNWVSSDDPNAIQNTIVDAKGDIITATAADTPARLAVGSNGALLTAASGESTGLKWQGTWTSYTPTLSDITLGNGTLTSRYSRIGNTVTVQIALTWGSTTSYSSDPRISLPVNQANVQPGVVWYDDAGPYDSYPGVLPMANNTMYLRAINAAGTYAKGVAISGTIPFTWASGDSIYIFATYEVAA